MQLHTNEPTVDDEIYLWGAQAIGQEIQRTPRQTRHLLDKGLVPGAFKLGGRWVARRGALRNGMREREQE